MLGRGHGQGEHIADGLVEAGVGSIAEGHWLVFVLQEVLDVAHLMVHRDQVVHSHNGALFDPGDTSDTISVLLLTSCETTGTDIQDKKKIFS